MVFLMNDGFHAAQLLGFRDFIPPYVSTEGHAVLRGLNYASGASGIRDETGYNLVRILFVYILTSCNIVLCKVQTPKINQMS